MKTASCYFDSRLASALGQRFRQRLALARVDQERFVLSVDHSRDHVPAFVQVNQLRIGYLAAIRQLIQQLISCGLTHESIADQLRMRWVCGEFANESMNARICR